MATTIHAGSWPKTEPYSFASNFFAKNEALARTNHQIKSPAEYTYAHTQKRHRQPASHPQPQTQAHIHDIVHTYDYMTHEGS